VSKYASSSSRTAALPPAEDADTAGDVASPWVHDDEPNEDTERSALNAATAVQSAEDVLSLEHALAAKRARQLYRELVTGLNEEAAKLLKAHPPKREAALSRLHEAKRIIETEGVRLAVQGTNEMPANPNSVPTGPHRGERVGHAVVEGVLQDELCFMTYYNLGRLCSRALFTKNSLHQPVALELSSRNADASGFFDVRTGSHGGQSMSTSTYLVDRWRLAKKWLKKALSHLPPVAQDNISVQIAAHAEYAMVTTALGDDASTAEAHADRVVQLATIQLRSLKSRAVGSSEQNNGDTSSNAAFTRESINSFAIDLKSASGALDIARLHYHARRLQELVRQVVQFGAGLKRDVHTSNAARGNRTRPNARGAIANPSHLVKADGSDIDNPGSLERHGSWDTLISESAPTIGLGGDGLVAGSVSDEVVGSSIITSRHRASTGRRRKNNSQNRHDGATTFCGDAVINRLAGPAASTRMIANGQIHRGVQKVPIDRPNRRHGVSSIAPGRSKASANVRTQKPGLKARGKHTATIRPSSAPVVAGRRAASSDQDEPMVMVSLSTINALEERCRILEESVLAQPDAGQT
jgi:hypothetical protein